MIVVQIFYHKTLKKTRRRANYIMMIQLCNKMLITNEPNGSGGCCGC